MINDITKAVFGSNLNKMYKLSDVLAGLDKLNLLDSGEMTEIAISNVSGIKQCAKMTENIDLESGKQIKHAKTYFRKGSWLATVSRNTTAPMLVVVTEQHTKKQYFFHIPYSAHSHLTGNTIGISCGPNGVSKNGQWWRYEVSSFSELCELAK